jgi:hypothetical protein
MTYQDYLDSFSGYTKSVYNQNIPHSSIGERGGILAMKSYLEDIPQKLTVINERLTSEANRILNESSKDDSIDTEKLKNEMFVIVRAHHNEWMQGHKPK